jgi:hypothetical protein
VDRKKKYGHEKFYEPSPVHFMPWQIFFLMLTMIIKIKNIITNNLFIFMLGWVTHTCACLREGLESFSLGPKRLPKKGKDLIQEKYRLLGAADMLLY